MVLINYFFTKQYSRGVDTVHGFSIYVISLLIHSILILRVLLIHLFKCFQNVFFFSKKSICYSFLV